MSILKELQQYAPRGSLQWMFMEDGFNVWAEAQLGDDGSPVRVHTKIPIDAGDMRFALDLGKVIRNLISKTRDR